MNSDHWEFLKRWTKARLALGRAGSGIPTVALLDFRLAHARARDAVHSRAEFERLKGELSKACGIECLQAMSAARDRAEYLKRPDLGRTLSLESVEQLKNRAQSMAPSEVLIVVADGLSATAINEHACRLTRELISNLKALKLSIGPVVFAEQARVALGDEIGEIFEARLVILLVGERPGLSNVESIGAYLTFGPKKGRTDAERNCISNICPDGLALERAASQIAELVSRALVHQVTGVQLSVLGASATVLPRPETS